MTQKEGALFSVSKGERELEGEQEGGGRRRETSPLLSLRWEFYGWVSLVRAGNT